LFHNNYQTNEQLLFNYFSLNINFLQLNHMKKDGIYIMLLGLAITILIAYFYFSKQHDYVMSKFVLTFGKSFHFNWAPMIGISVMAFGEFILWQSQNNKNLNEVKIKFLRKFKVRLSNVRLVIIYLTQNKMVNLKAIKFIVSVFHF